MSIHRRTFLAGACALPIAAQVQDLAVRLPEIPVLPPSPPSQLSGPYAGKSWKIQYLFDEDDAAAVLTDLRFGSAERGMAVGGFERKGKEEAVALITRDGGGKWTPVKLKDFPISLNLVDDSRAFAVCRDSLLFTNEGGASWARLKLPKEAKRHPMLRCSFLDDKRGWIFGGGITFYSTSDGGQNWSKVPESSEIKLKDENTVWNWMNWFDAKSAFIVGNSAAPPPEASRFPDWMMPERASRRRLLPSTTILGETRDGGQTWKFSYASIFGRVVRMRNMGARAIVVYHYGDGMEFPAEVYALDLSTGKSVPIFRRKDLWVQDAVPLASGGVVVAAIESPGRLRSTPVPGRLRIFLSLDGKAWNEMRVDYRATGRRAYLSRLDDAHIWAGTDEGVILSLSSQ